MKISSNLYNGFEDLEKEITNILQNAENVIDVLETGAEDFVKDLLKLPKPFSDIRKSGYTHLITTFSYRTKNKEVEVGWGKYYGPMLENGTIKMNARPHLKPLWEKNKDKYYNKMIKKLNLDN